MVVSTSVKNRLETGDKILPGWKTDGIFKDG
jgi:hypothetical protein